MSDSLSPDSTLVLLNRMHDGDAGALGSLLERDLEWVRAYVQRRLGGIVREHRETGDVVHDVVLRVLKHGPRFRLSDRGQFRKLLACIVVNCLRNAAQHAALRARAVGGDGPLLDLDGAGRLRSDPTPSEVASRNEEEEWVRLALALLPAPVQEVLRLRQWDKLPFGDIAERLDVSEDAARMRFHRALQQLMRVVVRLKAGKLEDVLADVDRP